VTALIVGSSVWFGSDSSDIADRAVKISSRFESEVTTTGNCWRKSGVPSVNSSPAHFLLAGANLRETETEDALFERANSRQSSNGRKCASLARPTSESSFAVADPFASLTIHSTCIAICLCRTFKMSHGRSGPLALASGSASFH